jgi:cob(I)alamin adenosyltransferase
MPIYTRTGDDGTTALYGGRRLLKSDPQVEAYGCVDELTTTLGILMLYIKDREELRFVGDIQLDLYAIMSSLAQAPTNLSNQKRKIMMFEEKIDSLTGKLPPLTHFILPQGPKASCWAHMARVICRKTERAVIFFFKKAKKLDDKNTQIIVKYLNRLSDLLFTYARSFNTTKEIATR